MRKIGVTPELVALLNARGPLAMADLYTITLAGGGVLQYSGADVPVTIPATRNDLLWSEDFSQSAWGKSAMNVDVDALTDPIGTTTMDKLRPTTGSATHAISQAITVTSAPWTVTLYTKASGYRWLLVTLVGMSICLDTLNGVAGASGGGVSVVVTSFGNGIYRWDLTATQSATATNLSIYVNNANSASPTTFAGDGTSAIGVWGVMAYPGSAFVGYQKTTNASANVAARTFSRGPQLDRGPITHKIGVEVSTLQIDMGLAVTDQINGVPAAQFIAGNGLDGARLRLERAFLSAWGQTPTGALVDFDGRLGPIGKMTESLVPLTVISWMRLLNVNMPADLFQSACLNATYDTNCGLTKSSFKTSTSVTGGPSSGAATTTDLYSGATQADDYFSQGQITFTSGANNGVTRAVKKFLHTNGQVSIVPPLPVAPSNGDTFDLYPGDDHSLATCTTKFSNRSRFRGTPFVPQVETAV